MDSPLLAVEHVSKAYAGIPVLQDVSFTARRGEILAIVGENGAGKSTLMRILAGVVAAGEYEGRVVLDDQEARFGGPLEAEHRGVVMIPQELAVVPDMSVAENLLRNREPTRLGLIDSARMAAMARDILAEFEIDVDPDRHMRGLGLAHQQLVEIAKALSKSASVLILDEPTASLTQAEADRLFERLRRLRDLGYLCLYISHRIDEVLALADRVAVLRDGILAGIRRTGGTSHRELVDLMLGRSLAEVYPVRPSPQASDAPPALSVERLCVDDQIVPGRRILDDVSFEVRRGEILGIFGLIGAGRTELAMTLFGVPPGPTTGRVLLDGHEPHISSPQEAIAAGIALVTEDRRRFGFIPEFGPRRNFSLATLGSVSRRGWLDPQREEIVAERLASELALRAASLDQPVRTLSGGNQQKVVVGKWLATVPRVLLLDEPTRGIDVGAKVDVYQLFAELAERGVAIVFISSEADEIIGMADRVLVMARGRVVGERGRGARQEDLLHLATGGSVRAEVSA